jgi:ribosome-associated heat shock protein Hsp15
MDINDVRIDKFLWAMRIYKTRSIATEECDKGRISIDKVSIKPSRKVKIGETIMVRKPPVTYSFLVKKLTDKRLSASLVSDYITDITPKEELEKLEMSRIAVNFSRDRGAGRPTKKDRRDIENIINHDED